MIHSKRPAAALVAVVLAATAPLAACSSPTATAPTASGSPASHRRWRLERIRRHR